MRGWNSATALRRCRAHVLGGRGEPVVPYVERPAAVSVQAPLAAVADLAQQSVALAQAGGQASTILGSAGLQADDRAVDRVPTCAGGALDHQQIVGLEGQYRHLLLEFGGPAQGLAVHLGPVASRGRPEFGLHQQAALRHLELTAQHRHGGAGPDKISRPGPAKRRQRPQITDRLQKRRLTRPVRAANKPSGPRRVGARHSCADGSR